MSPSPAALARFAGAGGVPPRADLLLITAEITCDTDTAIGAGGTGDRLADSTVRRDPATGLPMIPAPSPTGVLRHRLAELAGPDLAEALFGTDLRGADEQPDRQVRSAALEPRDAIAIGGAAVGWRTGNTVDSARRTVRPGGLFTEEVVPAGTRFVMIWQVWVPHDDAELARRVFDATAVAGHLLDSGLIAVGRRTGIGRGVLRTRDWRARWFALATEPADVAAWYRTSYDDTATLTAAVAAEPTAAAALTRLQDAHDVVAFGDASRLDTDRRLTITGTLSVAERVGAQVVPSTTVSERFDTDAPTDSGAKVKALLRTTAARALDYIATGAAGSADLDWDIDQARQRARSLRIALFGPHPGDNSRTPSASRVALDEAPLTGAYPVTLYRVRNHPLTRGVVSGAFGVVRAHYGGSRTLTLTVRDPNAAERGILALVLKDLCEGTATLGGPHRRLLERRSVRIRGASSRGPLIGWEQMRDNPDARADVTALVDWIRYGRT
ncbi:RAMP superfamily CRISPR-associated protein [Nocardia puris]|uniref:RAMP superfamily CRISPR-associated protein n=1 Tax=Nocardia puris TaxID=208602 RepID=UPI002E246C62